MYVPYMYVLWLILADIPSLSSLSPDRLAQLQDIVASNSIFSALAGSYDSKIDLGPDFDFLIKLFASITPILGGDDLSDQCYDQSMAYLNYLNPLDGNFGDWALKSE